MDQRLMFIRWKPRGNRAHLHGNTNNTQHIIKPFANHSGKKLLFFNTIGKSRWGVRSIKNLSRPICGQPKTPLRSLHTSLLWGNRPLILPSSKVWGVRVAWRSRPSTTCRHFARPNASGAVYVAVLAQSSTVRKVNGDENGLTVPSRADASVEASKGTGTQNCSNDRFWWV